MKLIIKSRESNVEEEFDNIVDISEVKNKIIEFCQRHKVIKTAFVIHGNSEVATIVVSNSKGLPCLFG